MTDFDYYKVKIVADLSWYIIWGGVGYFFYRYLFSPISTLKTPFTKKQNFDYVLSIIVGWLTCGMIFSTLDNYLIDPTVPVYLTKSIAAAIFWGVLSSEVYKKIQKVNFNTGVVFVPWLVIWMIVGRIGAFLIGLRDHTHWLATSLPWGIDYGDGIPRHPLQIYEILVLAIFFILFCFFLRYRKDWTLKNGFFLFIFVYFIYRLLVGFISPYSHFWLWLNTYQVLSIWMVGYSLYKMKKYF